MREVFIKYNPYRLETTVEIDGRAPKPNSKLNFEDRRLQEWIEDLPDILFEECSDRDFSLTFHGTVLDYEDVEAVVSEAEQKNIHIHLKHIPAKEVADKERAISEIFNEIQQGPFDELKQPDVIRAFEMARGSEFEVSVVATFSAGKSTLINALLQQKLMPSKNEACTATITEIKDNDAEHFSASVYNVEGQEIYKSSKLTLKSMQEWNNDPAVSRIRAEGNIPFVPADDVSLVLVDTPGTNNARNPEHKRATFRMLSESSKALVLYVVNATNTITDDTGDLIKRVAESMQVGGKQSRDRFLFVVNKMDGFRVGEDNVDETLANVRGYLEGVGINNANVYPASALTALDIRTVLSKSADDDDAAEEAMFKVKKFNKRDEIHFETYAPLPPSARREIEEQLHQVEINKDVNEQALIHCGIVPIEKAIQIYVQKYAKTAKIKNIVDTFSKRLESAKSFEPTKQEIAENLDKQKQVSENIDRINRKLASGENAKNLRRGFGRLIMTVRSRKRRTV